MVQQVERQDYDTHHTGKHKTIAIITLHVYLQSCTQCCSQNFYVVSHSNTTPTCLVDSNVEPLILVHHMLFMDR